MIHKAKNKIVESTKRQIRRIIFLFKGVDVDELLCFLCFPDVCPVRGAKKTNVSELYVCKLYLKHVWSISDFYLNYIWNIYQLYIWTICMNSMSELSSSDICAVSELCLSSSELIQVYFSNLFELFQVRFQLNFSEFTWPFPGANLSPNLVWFFLNLSELFQV